MQINSNNQTPFGESYRLLIPKGVEYTSKDATKQISKSLLNSHIIMNTPRSRIKVLEAKAISPDFNALDIFTLKQANEIDDTRKVFNGSLPKVVAKIKELSSKILENNTHVIKNDSELGGFIKSFIYKDLGIENENALASVSLGQKGSYVIG